MKNIINKFKISCKIKYFLLFTFSFIIILTTSLIVYSGIKSGIKKTINVNQTSIKEKIRNNILKTNPQGKINYIFINTTPDDKTTIYAGGENLLDSKNIKGALLESFDNGITWTTDMYYTMPTKGSNIYNPIVNKIMTSFYNDQNGKSDSIVVMGAHLRSLSNTKNGNSVSSGQVAYSRVFFSTNGTVNKITSPHWNNVEDKDIAYPVNIFDTNLYSEKVIAASTVTNITDTNNLIQDSIYIITADYSVSINWPDDITYTRHDENHTIHKGKPLFLAYKIVISNVNITFPPSENKLTDLTTFLNPSFIYGTVIYINPYLYEIGSLSTFDFTKTSFQFISNFLADKTTTKNGTGTDKCFIIENLHFNKPKANIQTTNKNKISFDYPIIIENNISNNTSKYLSLNSEESRLSNFIIKTVARNPMIKTYHNNFNDNFFIFAGEKNNESYMISPSLDPSAISPNNMVYPTVLNDSTYKTNSDKSLISKVISYPVHVVSNKKRNHNLETTIMPLIIYGKNISSSNNNIVFPDPNVKFTPNVQKLSGQGLLLANIHFNNLQDPDTHIVTTSTSVYYSRTSIYSPSNNFIPTVRYVDNSNNYATPGILSFKPNYIFYAAAENDTGTYVNGANINNFQISKNTDEQNNFNFKHNGISSKKSYSLLLETIIPIGIIVIIFIASIPLYWLKMIAKRVNVRMSPTRKSELAIIKYNAKKRNAERFKLDVIKKKANIFKLFKLKKK